VAARHNNKYDKKYILKAVFGNVTCITDIILPQFFSRNLLKNLVANVKFNALQGD